MSKPTKAVQFLEHCKRTPGHCVCDCKCSIKPKHLARGNHKEKGVPQTDQTDCVYLMHKQRLKKIAANVDDKPPILEVARLVKTDLALSDIRRILEINQQNKVLLKRINVIYRLRGVVDSYNPLAGIRTTRLKTTFKQLNEYEKENHIQYERLLKVKPVILNSELERSWRYQLKCMAEKAKYKLILPGLVDTGTDVGTILNDCIDQYRARVFLDIAVKNGRTLGRITILLYSDLVPITTTNFLELIMNYEKSKRNENLPHFVDSSIYRVFRNLYAECGDMNNNNGTGGISATVADFAAENCEIPFKFAGTVAMIPDENNMINSKFLISFKPLSVLNGKYVVFGRVIKGLDVLKALEASARQNGKSRENMIISNCGVIKKPKIPKCSCSQIC